MPIVWGQMFQNKHLHIVNRVMTTPEMKAEGIAVWQARNGTNDAAKKARFGKIQLPMSTLIVLSRGDFQRLDTLANATVVAPGTHYALDVHGLIVHVAPEQLVGMAIVDDPDFASFGSITVSAIANGANLEINHLVTATLGNKLSNHKISPGGQSFDMRW